MDKFIKVGDAYYSPLHITRVQLGPGAVTVFTPDGHHASTRDPDEVAAIHQAVGHDDAEPLRDREV